MSNTQGPQGECLDGSWGWDTTVSGLYLHPFLLAWPQTHYDEWDLAFKPKSQDQQWQKNTFGTTIFCYLEQLVFTVLLHLGLLTPGEMQERDTHITGGGVGDRSYLRTLYLVDILGSTVQLLIKSYLGPMPFLMFVCLLKQTESQMPSGVTRALDIHFSFSNRKKCQKTKTCIKHGYLMSFYWPKNKQNKIKIYIISFKHYITIFMCLYSLPPQRAYILYPPIHCSFQPKQ